MIHVNLLPVKQIRAEVTRRRDLVIGGVALGLTAAVILGAHLYQSYRMSKLENEIATVRGEIKALDVKVKAFGDLQKQIKEFESKHKIIEDLNRRKVGPVRVMESLSAATPPTLWLTEFKETGGKLVITGLALDNQTVADFLKALASFHYFRDVELVETTEGGTGNTALRKFAVKSLISYQPQVTANTTKDDSKAAVKKQEKKG
jgi:type IV pilus assembly protein PilN